MEGYLDVARAHEAGVAEAVATCGTALTAGHARLIRRFTPNVVVNFDQDEAGQKAARKSLDILIEEGLSVKVVRLPAGHDPDTFVKAEGAAAYRRCVDEATDALDWLIRKTAAACEIATPRGKADYLTELLPVLAKIQNAVERSAWLKKAVDEAGLDERAAQTELRRALGQAAQARTGGPGAGPGPAGGPLPVTPAAPHPSKGDGR